jgi:hypothetical protein
MANERVRGAVWFASAMGLLEDAIREHLDLKRLRGADPAEVAREQHEALEPPATAEPATWADGPPAAGEDGAHAAPEHPPAEGPAAEAPSPENDGGPAAEHPVDPPQAMIGQETAELDMRAVLEEHPVPSDEQESLEWDVPARSEDTASSGPETGTPEHDSA